MSPACWPGHRDAGQQDAGPARRCQRCRGKAGSGWRGWRKSGRLPGRGEGLSLAEGAGGTNRPGPPQVSTAQRTWMSASSCPMPARMAAPATTPTATTTACASMAGRARTVAKTLTTAPAPPASGAPPATTAWPLSTASVPTAARVSARPAPRRGALGGQAWARGLTLQLCGARKGGAPGGASWSEAAGHEPPGRALAL